MAGFYARIKSLGIPNLLSILRIILIPVFISLFFSSFAGSALIAAAVLVLSGVTDIADGIIARKYHMITELGQILDPLADKLTQATVCVCLVARSAERHQNFMSFLLFLFIIKEILMIAGGANLIRKGREMISSKWFGKLATVIFYLVMITIIAFPKLSVTTLYFLLIISLAFMFFSFIMYIRLFLGQSHREKAGVKS